MCIRDSHGGYNGLFGLMLFQKMQGFLEKHPNLSPFLSFEELRAGGEQSLHHTTTVFPGTTTSGGNLPL